MRKKRGDKKSVQHCVKLTLIIVSSSRVTNFSQVWVSSTLGTRGFSRVRREVSVLAEGRHFFGRSLWHPG